MPPLEKRQPNSPLAVIEHSRGSSHHHIVSDPASEIADPLASCASVKKATRKLRSRRRGLPSVENPGDDEVLGNSVNAHHSSTSQNQIKKKRTSKKNIIFNTRNPAIIWLANNELHLSLFLLAIVHGCYWAGYQWPLLWIQMQHKATTAGKGSADSHDTHYVRGIHDIKFVAYWIVQIIAARALCLHHIMPVVARLISIKGSREIRRFSEMAWMLLYITVTWTIGFRVWQSSPYYMNTANLYTNYPDDHMLMPYGLKWYYLVQSAFWLSNVYTIHVEERRKDHFEMMTHHVVTIFLVLSSYQFHFTRFGHAFMLVMDFPDIFLTSAKMFRYIGSEIMPNILFGIFTVSWIATKHYLCLKMMISIWTQGIILVPHEKRFPHYPNSYASYPIVGVLWALLCVLQLVLVYWFVLIVKVIQRVLIKGEGANDNRSDDEDISEDQDCDTSPDAASSNEKTFTADGDISSCSSLSTLAIQTPNTV
ncbi:Sphingosine N-acyltransferase lag1 [Coemansia sp. RSA 1813]|nr:Sphingosine N-acyltransferase lag1 [Coemansia sp. RSA 1646]KAJ1766673.1 Sphingosine N-acyltransferase lag1 [Coemansia sp. RSA 1843]KAJ2088687.1 Sphingosine N-acyltransferase lag1 [Coemansia sp. RSA 986]KAJ2213108.1 Sphingosine N-acyltransferase lag1 [Coemansia sp. RSA 487]KAJ2568588.1 Sphingosine N-acyltransferase lag1 [Coemansia sp. RSA 1813]